MFHFPTAILFCFLKKKLCDLTSTTACPYFWHTLKIVGASHPIKLINATKHGGLFPKVYLSVSSIDGKCCFELYIQDSGVAFVCSYILSSALCLIIIFAGISAAFIRPTPAKHQPTGNLEKNKNILRSPFGRPAKRKE